MTRAIMKPKNVGSSAYEALKTRVGGVLPSKEFIPMIYKMIGGSSGAFHVSSSMGFSACQCVWYWACINWNVGGVDFWLELWDPPIQWLPRWRLGRRPIPWP